MSYLTFRYNIFDVFDLVLIEIVVTILTQVEINDGTNACISCMTRKSQLSYRLLGEVCKNVYYFCALQEIRTFVKKGTC